MTKRISGVATLKGVPKMNPRLPRDISHIGTFYDGPDGEDIITSILLEVADTPHARKQGLMGRKDLPSICGMLFRGLSGGGFFWMKDCLIPLDVMFLDKDGSVTRTYSMPVDKGGRNHYDYEDGDVDAIEVNMGFCRKHGISPGVKVKISRVGKGKTNG